MGDSVTALWGIPPLLLTAWLLKQLLVPSALKTAAIALYVLNPYVLYAGILGNVYTRLLDDVFPLLLLLALSRRWRMASMFVWIMLFATSPYQAAMVLVPSILLLIPRFSGTMGPFATDSTSGASKNSAWWRSAVSIGMGVLCLVCRHHVAPLQPLVQLAQHSSVDASSLEPELSLHWYLMSSAFQRFLPYFKVIAWGQPLVYVAPACIRFWRAPGVAWLLLFGLSSVLDPTAGYSIQRVILAGCLLMSEPTITRAMKSVALPLGFVSFALYVAPTLKYVWIRTATWNPNLLWIQQMSFAIAASAVLAEFAAAALRVMKEHRHGVTVVATAMVTPTIASPPLHSVGESGLSG